RGHIHRLCRVRRRALVYMSVLGDECSRADRDERDADATGDADESATGRRGQAEDVLERGRLYREAVELTRRRLVLVRAEPRCGDAPVVYADDRAGVLGLRVDAR